MNQRFKSKNPGEIKISTPKIRITRHAQSTILISTLKSKSRTNRLKNPRYSSPWIFESNNPAPKSATHSPPSKQPEKGCWILHFLLHTVSPECHWRKKSAAKGRSQQPIKPSPSHLGELETWSRLRKRLLSE